MRRVPCPEFLLCPKLSFAARGISETGICGTFDDVRIGKESPGGDRAHAVPEKAVLDTHPTREVLLAGHPELPLVGGERLSLRHLTFAWLCSRIFCELEPSRCYN